MAATYVVVAWVIVQVATAIEEPLRLPEWFDTIVVALLILGFPIALVLSWAYEVTPDGVVRDDKGRPAPRSLQIDYGKVALAAVLILGAFMLGDYVGNDPQPTAQRNSGMQRFTIPVSRNYESSEPGKQVFAISPNGKSIVVRREIDGRPVLYRRELKELAAKPIAGTEGVGDEIAISPDSEYVVFAIDDETRIVKVPLRGGIPITLATLSERVRYFDWSDNDQITFGIFSSRPGINRGPMLVPAAGGSVATLTDSEPDLHFAHSTFVPGSEWLVSTIGEIHLSNSADDDHELALVSPAGNVNRLGISGSSPRITQDGRLLYFSEHSIWQVDFDFDDMTVSQTPVPVVSNVVYRRHAYYDMSREGSLIYVRDSAIGKQRLVWVDSEGRESSTGVEPGTFSHPAVSPDGHRIAVTVESIDSPDLWIFPVGGGKGTQWTFELSRETLKVWSPDGRTLFFEAGAAQNVHRLDLSGTGTVEQLFDSAIGHYPSSITPDGQQLLIDEWYGEEGDGNNVGILEVTGSGRYQPLMATEYRESHPRLSPDGSLIAFMSNVGGPLEIYVRKFPFTDERQIKASTTGDSWQPRWNSDGTALFYWDRDDALLYRVPINRTPDLAAGEPTPLFSTQPYAFEGPGNYDYDANTDQFLMVRQPPPGLSPYEMILVQNWPELVGDD